MPIIGERVLRIRIFDGIDLNIDARTVNPRAWKKLSNYYPRTRGRLEKRPGSTLLTGDVVFDTAVDSLSFGLDPFVKLFTPGTTIVQRSVRGIKGLIGTPLIDAGADTIFGALSWTTNQLNPDFTPADGLHDALFFVDSNDDIVVLETFDGTIKEAGQLWQFLKWPRSESLLDSFVTNNTGLAQAAGAEQGDTARVFIRADGTTVSGGLLLATNKVDPLIGIWQSGTNNNPKAGPMTILRGSDRFYVSRVQALIKYAGSIILGGGRFQGPIGAVGSGDAGTLEEDLRNFVFFLDIDDYDRVGAAASLQIGDTPEGDPITALGIVTAQTDSMGLRGQLAVFTATQVQIFDGPPPQSAVPISAEFRNAVTSNAGCSAPNTVIQTPAGLMYLGTDSNVYLIRPSDRPRTVGRAIEPALRNLTIEQMNFATAVFDRGFYKLAVPIPGSGLGADDQYWADIRQIQFGEYDLSVRWTGPHRGQQAGPFIVLTGFRDAREVFMGSHRFGRIFRVTDETVRTDNGIDIRAIAESTEFDGGDAHIDKDFIGLELGLSTNRQTTVDIVVSSMSNESCISDADQFTEVVDPCGPTWGTFNYNLPVTTGAVFYAAGQAFELIKKRPANRLRGRMFKVTITEDSNALTSISDFGLRLRAIRRRGT